MRVLCPIVLLLSFQVFSKDHTLSERKPYDQGHLNAFVLVKAKDALAIPSQKQAFKKKNKVKGIEPASPLIRDLQVKHCLFPGALSYKAVSLDYSGSRPSVIRSRGPPVC